MRSWGRRGWLSRSRPGAAALAMGAVLVASFATASSAVADDAGKAHRVARAPLAELPKAAKGTKAAPGAKGPTAKVGSTLGAAQRAAATTPRDQWGYLPVPPMRLLDTRPGSVTVDGAQVGGGPLGAGESAVVLVGGRHGLPPDSEIDAVVVNLTGIHPTAPTYLTVHRTGAPVSTSTLNLAVGEVAANLAILPVYGTTDNLSIYNAFGSVDIAVDIVGYVRRAEASDVWGTWPIRVVDTRPGEPTFDDEQSGSGRVGPGQVLSVDLGRPALDAEYGTLVGSVVALNVTAVAPSASTFFTVFPSGAPRPVASSLNVPAGVNRPNLVFVQVGDNSKVDIYNHAGTSDVVVDLLGVIPVGANLLGSDVLPDGLPTRVLDTRPGEPTFDGLPAERGALGPGQARTVPIAGRLGLPPTARAVLLNVTGTAPTSATYLSVYPGAARPVVSTLNLTAGMTRANATVVPLAADGSITVFNFAGSTHVVVDVVGYVEASDPVVTGRYLGLGGVPLSGAVVTATSLAYPYVPASPGVVTTTTDAQGWFELPLPLPGLWSVCSDGLAGEYDGGCFTAAYVLSFDYLFLGSYQLTRPIVLSGRVTSDVGGAPLGNVGVIVSTPGSVVATRTTTADGRYSIVGLTPGTYSLFFNAGVATGGSSTTGYASEYSDGAAPFQAHTQIVVGEVDLVVDAGLAHGVAVEGQVTSHGLPVGVASVQVIVNDYSFGGTQTDAQGHYRIQSISPGGQTSVVVRAEGLQQPHPYGYEYARVDVAASTTPGQVLTGDVSLLAYSRFTGKVVDRTGAPLVGATVYVYRHPYEDYALHVLTEADGRFTTSILVEGTYHVGFRYSTPAGDVAEWYDNVPLGGATHPTVVTLPPGVTSTIPTVELAVN